MPFALRCAGNLPERVAGRLQRNLLDNEERWHRMKGVYREVSDALESAGLEFAVLKGFSHVPAFAPSPGLRVQYDLDLLLAPDEARRALDVAVNLDYEAVTSGSRRPVDHLPTMIRKTRWQWRGDFFDPDMLPALELHFRLWDAGTEGFAVEGVEDFWNRRERRAIEDLEFTSLAAIDLPAYASAHALRHLLRGDLQPSHIYEIATFLDRNDDSKFWLQWRQSHDETLRRVQAICFALARAWFGCRVPSVACEEIERLREAVHAWLARYGQMPAAGLFESAKNELWLHLSLLDPGVSRAPIVWRRLIPLQLPGPMDTAFMADEAIDWRVRLRSVWRQVQFVWSRIRRHTGALLPTLASGTRWGWSRLDLSSEFWAYFAASAFFDFGLFIFFLLFNLYLLKLGYNESFLGIVSGCTLIGSVAGSIPAAIAIERLGLRGSMIACLTAIPVMAAIMAAGLPAPLLAASAFIYGLMFVMWAVLLSPAVAALTNERNRGAGFSIICSSGIGIGILGSTTGGRLPGWIARVAPHSSVVAQYRTALWIGCALVLAGLVPVLKLPRRESLSAVRENRRLRRPPREVIYFLVAVAVWNLGTGAFNPFFTAFFERLHMPVARIGVVFSLSQLGQALAILAAPLVFRAMGLIRGISRMQMLSAIALAGIAASGGQATAALAYGAYMVLQNMSEPGMFTYLMESVPEAERSGVSALNFLVASSTQAIAAVISGALLKRFGYPPVLVLAAVICAIASILIRSLAAKPSRVTVSAEAAENAA